MKNKALQLPAIIIAIGLVLSIVAYFLTGILKVPAITEHDFNYSATYEIDGQTKTLEGVYRVCFQHVGEGISPLDRYYEGFYPSDPTAGEPKEHTIAEKDGLELRIVFIFTNDFLMGDGDRGEQYFDAIPEPYLAVYDDQGCEYQDSEMLEKFDANLISWETPQPIENTFVFSGFARLHDGSMVSMLWVSVATALACIILVKKDETIDDKTLDKVSIVFNYIIAFVAIPFITLVAFLMGTYSSGDEIIYQIDRCVPAIAVFSIAASISLRRKGFAKSGFLLQFIGPALFIILIILETVI